jgi:two-component system osmolarity sensor histidine kinase EnvZ
MKLALAVADDGPEMQDLARDVAEMEHMVEGFLAFARGEEGEPAQPVDPAEIIEEVAADARRQGELISVFSRIETPDDRTVELKPQAIKRCLANLVGNAATHGSEIHIAVRLTRPAVEFTVEDDGPGIPPEEREAMLKPFTRGDSARGQNVASGVGLGLSIALDVARSHGGSLTLDQSPRLGGLRASVMIPR